MNIIEAAAIEVDEKVPLIRITRDFAATPAQVMRAHTDPELFARWVGPSRLATRIDYWDARTGGSWRYVAERDGVQFAFRGCFHEVRADRLVQTFTYEDVMERPAWVIDTVRRALHRPFVAPNSSILDAKGA